MFDSQKVILCFNCSEICSKPLRASLTAPHLSQGARARGGPEVPSESTERASQVNSLSRFLARALLVVPE